MVGDVETHGCKVGLGVGRPVGHEPKGGAAVAFVFDFEAERLKRDWEVTVERVFGENFEGGAVDHVEVVFEEDGEEVG